MTSASTRTEVTDVKFTTSSSQPSDVTSLAEAILTQALEFCATKLNLESYETAVERLQQGDNIAFSYWRYGLAKKGAEYLGEWDEGIKAVYIFDFEATPEDICFAEVTPDIIIHLIVWAQRKTAALNSLIGALDRALVRIHVELLHMPQLKHLLDVQVVDDRDVENRLGFGALFSSLHHRPLPVWKR
jgi:hypothetical protein